MEDYFVNDFLVIIAFCAGYLISYITGYSTTWLIIIVVSFIVVSLQEYFKEDDKHEQV